MLIEIYLPTMFGVPVYKQFRDIWCFRKKSLGVSQEMYTPKPNKNNLFSISVTPPIWSENLVSIGEAVLEFHMFPVYSPMHIQPTVSLTITYGVISTTEIITEIITPQSNNLSSNSFCHFIFMYKFIHSYLHLYYSIIYATLLYINTPSQTVIFWLG